MRTNSGEPLRNYLRTRAELESVIDFGDLQIFEGVTTYPAIITMRRAPSAHADGQEGELRFLHIKSNVPEDLARAFRAEAKAMPRARLGDGSWQLEGDKLAALRAKIQAGKKTLGEVYGAPLYGIKTGLNEAFIMSRERRDKLVARDARSDELLGPFLRGENVKRWCVESEDLWLLNIPFGWTRKRFAHIAATKDNDKEAYFWRALCQAYPAVADHLAPFEQKARARTDQCEYWWELRACAYSDQFRNPKIIYPDMSQGPKFSYDESGAFCGNTIYFVASHDSGLMALLNSRVAWMHIFGEAEALRGGKWRVRMFTENITTIPIPETTSCAWSTLGAIGKAIICASEDRAKTNQLVLKHIPDLCPLDRKPKLTERLKVWWTLDFKSFQAEIKKAFKADIPLKKRNEWENFLREEGEKVRRLTAEIEQAEREIDAIVYKLFDLTPDEIALLESSLAGQY